MLPSEVPNDGSEESLRAYIALAIDRTTVRSCPQCGLQFCKQDGCPPGTGRRRRASASVGWQDFGKMLLVFGCIGSDFCKKICV